MKCNLWFFKTVSELNNKSEPRARLLPNQQFLDADGRAQVVDPNLNVQADKTARNNNSIGTVFGITELLFVSERDGKPLRKPYYTTKGKLYILTGPNQTDDADVLQAYKKWAKDGTTPYVAKFDAPHEVKGPVEGSRISDLIKKFPCPTIEDHGIYIDPLKWSQIIFNLNLNKNTLLVGPSGTAKTYIASYLSSITSSSLTTLDMSTTFDPVTSLIGTHRHNMDKGGSYFDRAPFTYALQKPGHILLDELTRATPQALNILFPVLDWRRELYMDMAPSDEERVIKVHKDCWLIGTANLGADYTGTSELDKALKNRFTFVELEHPTIDIEVALLTHRTGILKKGATLIANAAALIREAYKNMTLNDEVSMRDTLYCAELCVGGFSYHDAIHLAFLPQFRDHDRSGVSLMLQRL